MGTENGLSFDETGFSLAQIRFPTRTVRTNSVGAEVREMNCVLKLGGEQRPAVGDAVITSSVASSVIDS